MFANLIAADAAAKGLPTWAMYLILGGVLVLMLGFSFFQNKKRTKQHNDMMNSLTVGTKIMTIGRMVGKIAQVNSDNTLVINVGTDIEPTLIVIDRAAIGMVLEKNEVAPITMPTVEEKVEEKEEDPCGNCDIPEVEIPETPDIEFPEVKFPDEE